MSFFFWRRKKAFFFSILSFRLLKNLPLVGRKKD
jgi:hypothetical protein